MPTRSLLLVAAIACAAVARAGDAPFPVRIEVDAAGDRGPVPEIWRFFGADEPNYATMPHGRKLLGELGHLRPKQVYFRAHNLLTTGDGTPALKWGSTNAYTEDPQGRPVYDWTILDGIFDAYLASGVRPYAQIGFMPEALSAKPQPYRHRWRVGAPYDEIYTGWAHPPTDYAKWEELVFRWVTHCVDRYGAEEVAAWYWQTWNEPNIAYWQGTREEFFRLHDHAIAAVRRALPAARVGGPDVAGDGGGFMDAFLDHCLHGTNFATGATGTPLDFVSFHAKGGPTTVDGHVRMGIREHLRTIDKGFARIGRHPELADVPIVIGESDPEGCAACQGPQLAYRNGTMYSSYTAASFPRKLALARRHGSNLVGALTWAFEFEGMPWFAGFRSLATNGVDKPVLNVFRMWSRLAGRMLPVTSDAERPLDDILAGGVQGQPDVAAIASRDGDTLRVLAWHYHDDDVPGPDARVTVVIRGTTPRAAPPTHYRIDEHHSNAFTAWKRQGAPQEPTAAQRAELERCGGLEQAEPPEVRTEAGVLLATFLLPRAGVSLLEWAAETPRPDAVVAADGSGDFTSVQEAISKAPMKTGRHDPRWVILVKPGTYRERIHVQRERGNMLVMAEDAAATTIVFGLHANLPGEDGKPIGTFRTPTVWIDGDGMEWRNLTIANDAGPVGQALALRVDGDRVSFRGCRFRGWQDTILLNRGRQYFADCGIEGHVDFIFGGATAYFDRCRIHCLKDGYITAASTPDGTPHGFVFADCAITGADGVKAYLGRPWRDFARTVFLRTEMGGVIRPEGWHDWGKPHAHATTFYAEFGSTGAGATPESRVPWAKPLSADEAATLTPAAVLGGSDGWNPVAE